MKLCARIVKRFSARKIDAATHLNLHCWRLNWLKFCKRQIAVRISENSCRLEKSRRKYSSNQETHIFHETRDISRAHQRLCDRGVFQQMLSG